MELHTAQTVEISKMTAHQTNVYPELDRYQTNEALNSSESPAQLPINTSNQDLPPPTPVFSGTSTQSQLSGYSASPSTRFSESPGPYSRDTTPTSMCSQSPGVRSAIRIPPPRVRQGSISPAQTRPLVTRKRTGSVTKKVDSVAADGQGLAAVRESVNSSSSNSTVRDVERKARIWSKKNLTRPTPSPPPRISSQRFKKDEGDSASPAEKPRQGVVASPPPSKPPLSSKEGVTALSKAPPSRPSRDGAPDLQPQQFPGPVVIHSNLSSASITERRQSSSHMPGALPNSTVSSSSHQPSKPAPRREPTPAPVQLGSRKSAPSKEDRSGRMPSPGFSSFRSRFPMFGRRKLEPPVTTQEKSPPKSYRKGPVAGTGHEGYGKIGAVRRRSTSSGSNPARGIPSSQESLTSNDPFLMERVNPVIIAGGEVIENRNTSSELSRVDSGASSLGGYASASSTGSQGGRTTMWPSPLPKRTTQAEEVSRRPSNASSDSEGPGLQMQNTLAFRRSVQRLGSSPESNAKVPNTIVVHPVGAVASPSTASLDSSGLTSDDSNVPPPYNPLPATNIARKLTKKPGRWNFFGRSQAKKAAAETSKAVEAAVAVSSVEPQKKAVAFYAMVDSSEQEDNGSVDVEEVLIEANVLPPHALPSRQNRRPSTSANESVKTSPPPTPGERRPSTSSIMESTHLRFPGAGRASQPTHPHDVPSNGSTARSQPKPLVHARSVSTSAVPTGVPAVFDPFAASKPAPANCAQDAPKRSRLPQVGRIPKVVSRRQQPCQDNPPSAMSFSRPFAQQGLGFYTPPQQSVPQFSGVDMQSVAKGPSPPGPATPELTQASSTITTITSGTHGDTGSEAQGAVGDGREFLAFPPRKGSSCTSSTASSLGAAIVRYAEATAIVPSPGAPLSEDEIWDEYNDLMVDFPQSASSSHGKPFHLEHIGKQLESATVNVPTAIPTISASLEGPDTATQGKKDLTRSSVYSQDMDRQTADAANADNLTSTPFSVSELAVACGKRQHGINVKVVDGKGASVRETAGSQRNSASSRKSRRTNSSASSRLTADDESPLAQVNLRVGSMTVSKWLTFGHVLFSPVREDVENLSVQEASSGLITPDSEPNRQSILVVDGLGNDDWSFYAAETYPGATFYNLSPRAPLTDEQKRASSAGFPLTPSNHHQVRYTNYLSRFPFGTDSFTSVVYRFPVAAPDNHYRNIIGEARRVLKPGGFLELSILDVDFNNMGNRARRAVRGLKEKFHATRPDTNLSSTADLILKILNRRGFTDVKTCKVGVPVCAIPSQKESIDRDKKQKKKPAEQRSLADMMSDNSEMADKEITSMVAHVGRWWYSKCYESPAGVGTQASMWRDRVLLNECKELGTSLKLTVCHARVPEKGGLGRVASI